MWENWEVHPNGTLKINQTRIRSVERISVPLLQFAQHCCRDHVSLATFLFSPVFMSGLPCEYLAKLKFITFWNYYNLMPRKIRVTWPLTTPTFRFGNICHVSCQDYTWEQACKIQSSYLKPFLSYYHLIFKNLWGNVTLEPTVQKH